MASGRPLPGAGSERASARRRITFGSFSLWYTALEGERRVEGDEVVRPLRGRRAVSPAGAGWR